MLCAARASAASGQLILRIEDLDRDRVREEYRLRLLDELRWLGITWTEGPDCGGPSGPYVQSERSARYEEALRGLAQRGLLYYCDCSRTELARIASAPTPSEEGPRYPGLCRDHGLSPRPFKRPPAVRVRVEACAVEFVDLIAGPQRQDVQHEVGDFVLRRGDGVFSYQLAVVVDDWSMGITEVVRGADLLASTPRQILLAELLGVAPPRFAHVPLVVGPHGTKLSKRDRGVPIADQQASGRHPKDLIRSMGEILGIDLREHEPPLQIAELGARLDWPSIRSHPVDVSALLG